MNDVAQRRELIGAYERVSAIIWRRLSPTFGARTVAAITRQVIVRAARSHPTLNAIKVGPEGMDWSGFERMLGEIEIPDLRRMLDDLLDEFFEALASLMGDLLVSRIFRDADALRPKAEEEKP